MVLFRLSRVDTPLACALYTRVMGAWGPLPTRKRVSLKVNLKELRLLTRLKLPEGVLDLGEIKKGWVTVYQHPHKKKVRMTVYTRGKPARKRTFKMRGGSQTLVAVSVRNLTKEAVQVPTKTRKKSKKTDDELELEELESLEDLEDEDLDDEEPEDEEEEDEDEEDEDEEPVAKKKGKAKAKAKAKTKAKRKKAPVEDDEDDEDEEDEEDEKPRRKAKGKAKAAKGKAKAAPGEKLKAGRLSPADVEELSDGEFDARQIRLFLRANEDEWPKPDGQFRYSFTKKEAQQLIKAMRKA